LSKRLNNLELQVAPRRIPICPCPRNALALAGGDVLHDVLDLEGESDHGHDPSCACKGRIVEASAIYIEFVLPRSIRDVSIPINTSQLQGRVRPEYYITPAPNWDTTQISETIYSHID
jgi:hypothetical protein